MGTYYIYILSCSNHTYYTGYTTDMERRYREHAAGSVKCKYTRSFPPTELSACWVVESDLSFAMKLEAAIKRLPKAEKTKLIKCSDDLSSLAVGQQDYRVVRYQLCD